MATYVIRDTRFQRRDGKCQYVGNGSEASYTIRGARQFTRKSEARSAMRTWAKVCDYENPVAWLTIISVHSEEQR